MPNTHTQINNGMTQDEKNIVETIKRVNEWKGLSVSYKQIPTGFTNTTWEVSIDGNRYFVKIPGKGTGRFIDRDIAHQASIAAAEIGCGPNIIYWFSDTKVEIFEWLEGYRICTWRDAFCEPVFYKILDTMRKFHQNSSTLISQSNPFEQAWKMISLAKKEGGIIPNDLERAEWLLHRIEEAFYSDGIEYRPCHNDTCVINFMWNEDLGDIKMIDFEYASMSDVSNDLAIFSNDLFYEDTHDVEVIKYYYGEWNERVFARMKLLKLVSDVNWGMWASVQALTSTLDFDFVRNLGWKFTRLRSHWSDPRIDHWINLLRRKPLF